MVAEIPEMFASLKQYFIDQAQSAMADQMNSIMDKFSLENLLKMVTASALAALTGFKSFNMLYDVTWGIYYFYKSNWEKVGKYIEKGLNAITNINMLTGGGENE